MGLSLGLECNTLYPIVLNDGMLCKLWPYLRLIKFPQILLEYHVYTSFCCIYRFLANQAKDMDLRKWAAEGLAYLTLDADIKEELTNDHESIKALIEVAKVRLSHCQLSVLIIHVMIRHMTLTDVSN